MSTPKPVQRIAIVGTGTIGASWATHYLAQGFDVTATDPAPGAEAALRSYVEGAWDGVTKLGLAPGASPDRLKFTSDLPAALADADFVQENGPERPELKVKLFADIDDATPPDAIIASSSSGITMSEIQAQCRRPERTVIGHPFNPPHVIPLVEVVGGKKTSPETVRDAMAFYASIGKKPILLKKELPGHVANRIQSALYREVRVPDRSGRARRRRRRRCGVVGSRVALGGHGSQSAVASRRRPGRHPALHGHPDATHGRRVARAGQPRAHPGASATDRQGRPRRGATASRSTSSPPSATRCCSI